jgi:hypothetical protein
VNRTLALTGLDPNAPVRPRRGRQRYLDKITVFEWLPSATLGVLHRATRKRDSLKERTTRPALAAER